MNNGIIEAQKNNGNSISRARMIFAAIAALGICFVGGLILSEWIRVGIIADPLVISKYPFGVEGHGGWRYSSASTYAWSALVEGACLLGLGVFTFWSSIKAKSGKAAIGWAIFIIWFAIIQLNMLNE